MKYTVTLKDRRTLIANSDDISKADLEEAMITGQPVRISGTVVSGATIASIEDGEKTEDYGPHNMQIQGTIEDAARLIGDRPMPIQGMTPKTREMLSKTLKDLDPENDNKRQYLSSLRLAKKLHGDKTRDWGTADWERFASLHPDPYAELEEVDPEESKSVTLRVRETSKFL